MKNQIDIEVMKKRIQEALQGKFFKNPSPDMRTKHGKAFMAAWRLSRPLPREEAEAMRHKRAQRSIMKGKRKQNTFAERNKIAFDYLRNRSKIKYINDDHLRFSDGRSHYAKNVHDLRIINLIQSWHLSWRVVKRLTNS